MDACRKRRGAFRQWPLHPAAAGVPRPRSGGAQIGQGAARRLAAAGRAARAIVPLLDDLSLVALAFPAFNDGRSFSKAELLRSRHHFEGPIRATGQVLVDQLPHMLRLGFTEFEVSHPVLIKRARGRAHRRHPALLPAGGQALGERPEIFLAAHSRQLSRSALGGCQTIASGDLPTFEPLLRVKGNDARIYAIPEINRIATTGGRACQARKF